MNEGNEEIKRGSVVILDSLYAKNCKYVVKNIYEKYGVTWHVISITGKAPKPPYLSNCHAQRENLSLVKKGGE